MRSCKMSGMQIAKRIAVACFAGVLALCAAASAQQSDVREQREVSRGVSYTRIQRTTPAGEPWSIHVVEVSRAEKKIEVRSVRAAGVDGEMQREQPTKMALREAASGLNVVAVVNGDYDLPAPLLGVSDGLSVTAGAISTTGKPTWPAMAVTSSGEPLIGVPKVELVMESRGRSWTIASLNKPMGTTWGTGPHLFTREFRAAVKSEQPMQAVVIGKLSRGLPLRADGIVQGEVEKVFESASEVAIPVDGLVVTELAADKREPGKGAERLTGGPEGRPYNVTNLRTGEKVKLRVRVQMNGQKKIRDVIGGFPMLVEGGRKHIVGEPRASLAQRHPRTAVCYKERKIIFVVVDGRQPKLSVGMTLDELAELMVELGCTAAMNTDGGGSSVMAVAHAGDVAAASRRRRGGVNPPLQIVNSPSDGQERGRGNAWIVIRKK